ncbi:uncharacterized protein SCHCODRAFT_02638422 [Schizophyllum commune H4-8]|nr:uncharacterized protein SCHCODRAFT_02638422 [Schizophyllum commune H4-8]KAI5887540.1 hypothetical protein SCHCODRAFT_02638422 [Schizophyllum commune H4-8]
MSTETIPHQIDQAAPVSAFLGTENEAHGGMHGGEVSAALQDWIHRAMDALAAVGPPPVGVTPHSVGAVPHLAPYPALPAQDATLDVLPFRIDTSHMPAIPQDRLELIRAAFNYVRANLAHGGQPIARSDGGRSDSLVDGSDAVLGNLIVDGPECNADAAAGSNTTVAHQSSPSPSPPDVIPHISRTPTPTAVVVPTSNAPGHLVEDEVMADGMQGTPVNGRTMNPLPSAMGTAEHRDGTFSGGREEDEKNVVVARASGSLQRSDRTTPSTSLDNAAYDARALQKQEEQRRRVWEDKKRAWQSKDAMPTREDDGTKGHSSRAPKTRRQTSPPPALLSRLRDLSPDACLFSTSQRDVPQSLSPSNRSPRDRSPTPSTPPPSEYAGLPLIERMRPAPLVGRIGPPVDESYIAASSQRANDETRGRRTARAPRSVEPSKTPSCNAGPPHVMPTGKAGTAPIAAASVRTASASSRKFTSTSSRTIASAGSLRVEGARSSEHRLETASPRPVTLASSAPGSTTLRTAQEATSVGVGETLVSGNLPSDTMVVGDPVEPTTPSVAPAVTTTIIAPQITTPLPPSTTPSSIDDTSISPRNSGPLPSRADSASSAPRFQAFSASMSDDRNAGTMETRPHTSPRCTYRQIAEELLSSTIPLDRNHSTRAQEVAPAHAASIVLPTSPAAPAASTLTLITLSSVSEPTGKESLPFPPLPTRNLDSCPIFSPASNGSSSPPIDPAKLGEYIFGLPVDNPAPVPELTAPIEQTMEVEQDGEADQLVKSDEQSIGPLKVDEDEMDEPMKMDEHTAESVKMEEDTDEIKEEEEPVVKTENEPAPKPEDVKDEMLVPVELAPRYEPRALIPKSRQRSSASPSVGPSSSSSGQTNGQSFWIEVPSRTFPHGDYLPMSPDEPQPISQHQSVDLSPEQPLRRSPRTTRSVYRRASMAKAASPKVSASAPASKSSASAKSVTQSPSSNAPTTQSSAITGQSSSIAAQSSPAAAPSSPTFVQPPSAAARPSPASASHLATPVVSTSVASLGRTYRIPAPSDDEEEGTRVAPILKLRRMNDDHPLERPSKRVRWA